MLVPVVLSGGAGSRLWPVSREAYPKPFIRLPDGSTLLGKTLRRADSVKDGDAVLIVTNREHYFLTKDEYARSDLNAKAKFLLEPCGRNTAPAIAMAAFHLIEAYGKDVEMIVLPADHLITDLAAFSEDVTRARSLAAKGALVTFGVKPTQPETGYGYIECGRAADNRSAYWVARFVEKPDKQLAECFLASERFLWNSGIFCFRADAFTSALQICSPELYELTLACWGATDRKIGDKIDLNPELFPSLSDISVDYAVMEKHSHVAVVRAAFDWSDIGSWAAVGNLVEPDSNGNRIVGETITIDTTKCYIQSDSRVVAAVGLENVVIVDTPDALLVSDKERAQDVKRVVAHLKLNNHATHQVHRTVHRPWGTYTVLEDGVHHKIKRIVVKPHASLSLQMHHYRSEHWVVVEGVAEVTNGTREYQVKANQSTFIPTGCKHRLANAGSEPLVIIEVQTGTYLGEDDIVRFDDIYGRAAATM
jgi:mannose-1-phosphate guanylyltransferase / mannose-6-phosphate isomerase